MWINASQAADTNEENRNDCGCTAAAIVFLHKTILHECIDTTSRTGVVSIIYEFMLLSAFLTPRRLHTC